MRSLKTTRVVTSRVVGPFADGIDAALIDVSRSMWRNSSLLRSSFGAPGVQPLGLPFAHHWHATCVGLTERRSNTRRDSLKAKARAYHPGCLCDDGQSSAGTSYNPRYDA